MNKKDASTLVKQLQNLRTNNCNNLMNCKRPYSEFDNGYIDGYIAGINAVIGKLCQIVDSQNDHVCGFCDHCRSIGQDCKCALTCKFVDCWTDSCEKFTKMV